MNVSLLLWWTNGSLLCLRTCESRTKHSILSLFIDHWRRFDEREPVCASSARIATRLLPCFSATIMKWQSEIRDKAPPACNIEECQYIAGRSHTHYYRTHTACSNLLTKLLYLKQLLINTWNVNKKGKDAAPGHCMLLRLSGGDFIIQSTIIITPRRFVQHKKQISNKTYTI